MPNGEAPIRFPLSPPHNTVSEPRACQRQVWLSGAVGHGRVTGAAMAHGPIPRTVDAAFGHEWMR